MSKFSGKCDMYDHIFMSCENEQEAFEKFKGTKLYKWKPIEDRIEIEDISDLSENWQRIEYNSIKDLVPYYPYVISMCCCHKGDSNNSMVVLSSESFVDTEEREMISLYLKDMLRYYNKCKRKKIEFNKEEVLEKVCNFHHNEDLVKELIDRVAENGKKADIDGLKLKSKEFYREELKKEIDRWGI